MGERVTVIRRITVGVMVAWCVTAPGTSWAQAEPETTQARPWAEGVSAEDQQQALQLLEQGNAQFVQGNYPEALATFNEALKHWDHPTLRYNLALTLLRLDQLLAAMDNLDKALAYGAAPLHDTLFKEATEHRKELAGQLARVHVSCREPGAEVALDGKVLFTAPGETTVWMLAGKHQLLATKKGFVTRSMPIVGVGGQEVTTAMTLVPLSALNETRRRWATWKPWSVIGGGVGVALIGVALQLKARSDMNHYNEDFAALCSGDGCLDASLPSGLRDERDRAKTENVLAISAFSIGGAAAVTGLVLVFANQPRTKQKKLEDVGPRAPVTGRVSVIPIVGPRETGLAARVSF